MLAPHYTEARNFFRIPTIKPERLLDSFNTSNNGETPSTGGTHSERTYSFELDTRRVKKYSRSWLNWSIDVKMNRSPPPEHASKRNPSRALYHPTAFSSSSERETDDTSASATAIDICSTFSFSTATLEAYSASA